MAYFALWRRWIRIDALPELIYEGHPLKHQLRRNPSGHGHTGFMTVKGQTGFQNESSQKLEMHGRTCKKFKIYDNMHLQ